MRAPKLVFFALLLMVTVVLAQSQQPPATQTGVLRLRVRVKADDSAPLRGLARKRFFLIPGTLEQNRALIDAIERQTVLSRDCYYQKIGASAALISWLRESDCESVYCRAVDQEFVGGPKAIPEFATAFATSQKEFGNDETARQWLTTNLASNVRDGFYRTQQTVLQTLLRQAGAEVHSVMTDRNGTAYFTDLGPGTYVLSNLIPTELGQTFVTWNCEVQVRPGDLATEKPYLVSNRKDRNVKCVGVEKSKPVCATN
ncbi:MAG TPA: hypothetical protein VGP98_12260 [Pyrinomonadaceae bacterium]|jgi:hypothetical protein|nr:hypothetical protein [Pyrinomonadaceae bacterium]